MNRSPHGISRVNRHRAPAGSGLRECWRRQYLANHIHEAPVWIVPCLEDATPTRTSGSSIYPAVQNMLLAARALGLGATLTTLHLQFEKEAEAALGLPPNFHSYALLPIGCGFISNKDVMVRTHARVVVQGRQCDAKP